MSKQRKNVGTEDYYYDFQETPEDYQESGPDSYFKDAQEQIREIYERDRQGVYYVRQMQIKLEKDYFHWITYNAMVGLRIIGYLTDITTKRKTGTIKDYLASSE